MKPEQGHPVDGLLSSRPAWARGLKHGRLHGDGMPGRSRPAWARGLKPHPLDRPEVRQQVAPRVGARIETASGPPRLALCVVAPRVGARIETRCRPDCRPASASRPAWARGLKHAPISLAHLCLTTSRPAWARGLKPRGEGQGELHGQSRPAWARGLKLEPDIEQRGDKRSRPAWARGLKHAPISLAHLCLTTSRPAWARGLKPRPLPRSAARRRVAPRVGARIETPLEALGRLVGRRRAPRGRAD